ncbi:MAG: hypothetical protein ACLFVP_06790 [Candidatus Bathyarchaeia archaeon]
MYATLALFTSSIGIGLIFHGFTTHIGNPIVVAGVTILFIAGSIIIRIIRSTYRTRYFLTDRELKIKATMLIGGEKGIIPLDSITSIEKTLIPFGIKLFGASFHGGYYKVPGRGRDFLK